MKNEKEIKPTVSDLVKPAREKAEGQILRAYFASVFEMSPLVDTFATWLLAVVGGTAALTIANLKSISSILPFVNIKVGLGLLLVSGLFGFLEKFLALDIRSTAVQESKLRDIFRESSEELQAKIRECAMPAEAVNIDINAEVDLKKPLEIFIKAHPWYKRIQIGKSIAPEIVLGRRLRRYYRQLLYTVLEFIAFLAFVTVAMLSL